MAADVLKTNKKRNLVEYNNKYYKFERLNENNNVSYYNCHHCGFGRLKSLLDGFVETKLCSFTCNSSPAVTASLFAKQALKKLCVERLDLTPQVCYENVRRDLELQCPEALDHFPTYLSMATNIKRAKKKGLPPIPTTFESIPAEIPLQFQKNFIAAPLVV